MREERGSKSVQDDFLVFAAPLIGEEEIREVEDSLRTGWLGTGPKVAKFEEMFRGYIGTRFALALNSCTAGLHLSMLVAGLGIGDEVITTPMTFCSTINTIIHIGAVPLLIDVDRKTQLIDPSRIEDAITPKTRAIVPVHLCGRPCDMDAIVDIAEKHGLIIIEDAAHATEAKYHNRKIGSISDLTCFSFYVTKNICTGEGGMVTTDNPDFAEKIKIYSLHGMNRDAWKRYSDMDYLHYEILFPGFKYNMMDLQAAIGIHQFKHIGEWLKRRDEIWRRYNEAFADLPVGMPAPDEPDTVHSRHLYTLMIHEKNCGITRDEFIRQMHRFKIGTGVHYIGIHLHPYYKKNFGFKREQFPNASWISDRTVSIPLSAKLSDGDVENIIETVRKIILRSHG